jgi:5'-phosphate synthase pdxT subunit
VERVGSGVEVLAAVDGGPVAAREGSVIVTAFHPELTPDTRVHRLFVDLVAER